MFGKKHMCIPHTPNHWKIWVPILDTKSLTLWTVTFWLWENLHFFLPFHSCHSYLAGRFLWRGLFLPYSWKLEMGSLKTCFLQLESFFSLNHNLPSENSPRKTFGNCWNWGQVHTNGPPPNTCRNWGTSESTHGVLAPLEWRMIGKPRGLGDDRN